MKSNEEIDEAMKKLEEITSDEELMRIIELRKKAIMDYNSGINNATKQGIEQGIKKIAKNMLKKNMDILTITELTGLSIEDIKKIES